MFLDEPSIGLHQRDNEKLIKTLNNLKNLGNTVIVVEHDEEAIRCADHIIDIGPGAGKHGGEICAEGTLKDILKNKNSITAQYSLAKKKLKYLKKGLSLLVIIFISLMHQKIIYKKFQLKYLLVSLHVLLVYQVLGNPL